MTPARAIQAGTIVNAEVLGWQDRIGSVEKGKYADLVAVPAIRSRTSPSCSGSSS